MTMVVDDGSGGDDDDFAVVVVFDVGLSSVFVITFDFDPSIRGGRRKEQTEGTENAKKWNNVT